MRKLVWQMMASLDGFMEGPKKEIDWHVVDDEFLRYVVSALKKTDTILFGRATYEMMAAFWPSAKSPEAPFMNGLPKIVFSRTLSRVVWSNSRLAEGNIEDEVRRLKNQPGKEIALYGSSTLASTLLRLGLIDEIRVFVNPVVLGRGNPMFKDADKLSLKLLKTQRFRSGNVLLYYQPQYSKRAAQK